jgi:hypothetical protein
MLNQSYLQNYNFILLTLDSLRFDVSQDVSLPNFERIFKTGNINHFEKVFSQCTYTLPSHVSMFSGFFPDNPSSRGYYNRAEMKMFSLKHMWKDYYNIIGVEFKRSNNIIRGFSANGYYTIGIGSVGWFNIKYASSKLWKTDYFDKFYWDYDVHEQEPRSFETQINVAARLLKGAPKSLNKFLFVNCGSTHTPYALKGISLSGQKKALEYVDKHILRLIELVPTPIFLIICADHGDCFGEDGLYGHGFFHPKVMEVPMAVMEII